MEAAGLALGVVGLAAQLFKTSMECYDILSDSKDVGADHEKFVWEITTERHRLIIWEKNWGIISGAQNQGLDPNDYRYRYAVGTLARIVSVFASVDSLSTKYGIRASNAASTPPGSQVSGQSQGGSSAQKKRIIRISRKLSFLTIRSKKGAPKNPSNATATSGSPSSSLSPSGLDPNGIRVLQNPAMLENKDLVPGLKEEIVQIEETTTRLQQILPSYRKLKWVVADKPKAKELIEELRRYNDGLEKILPGPGPGRLQLQPLPPSFSKFNIPVHLPVQRNKRFVGRGDLLQKIHNILKPAHGASKQGRQIAVLHGLGGMGKSQIVTEYAYRHSSSYTSVFWVDATSQATLAQSALAMTEQLVSHYQTKWGDSTPDFMQIGVMLGLPGFIKSTGQIQDGCSLDLVVRAIKNWLSGTGNDGWLVVFDNHDDIESIKLLDFFPTCDFGSILVTTRRPEVTHLGVGVEIGEIEEKAGISILLSSASKDPQVADDTSDYIEASKISERLGYLPLALEQAGAYISAMKIPLAEYIPLFNANFKRALSTNHLGLAESYRNETIFTTWRISFDSLPKPASELLLACSFFAIGNQDIPDQIFHRGIQRQKIPWLSEDDDFEHEALQPLFSFSFAKRMNDEKGFCFHPLVLEWTLESLDTIERQMKAKGVIVLLAESVCRYSVMTATDYEFERRILAHIDIFLPNIRKYLWRGDWDSIRDVDIEAADAMASIGYFLMFYGRDRESEDMIQKSLLSMNPNIHTGFNLQAIIGMGWICYRKERYEEALMYFERALAGQEQIYGKGHPITVDSTRSMASIFHSQGRYDEALELYEQVLAIQEQESEKKYPYTFYTLSHIVSLYNSLGRHQEALGLCKQVLAGQEQELGKEHPDVLYTVYQMATTTHRLGRYSESLELHNRALAGQERLLGKDHPNTLTTIQTMALLLVSQGRYQEAEALFRRKLASQERFGNEYADTLNTIESLATTIGQQGRYQEQLELRERSLAILEQVYGNEHIKTLHTVFTIGLTNQSMGRHLDSLELFDRALAGQKEVLGEEHPHTLKTICAKALAFHYLGRHTEAIEFCEKVLAGQEMILWKNHPDILDSVYFIAFAFEKLGRYSEALKLYEVSLAGHEGTFGEEGPSTLFEIFNMARFLYAQGEYQKAADFYRRGLAGRKKALGTDHPWTISAATGLAEAEGKLEQRGVEAFRADTD